MTTYKIDFTWDDEAEVWIATSEDIRGLVLEHESFDRLIQRVALAVPELLEMRGYAPDDISLDCAVHRIEKIRLYG